MKYIFLLFIFVSLNGCSVLKSPKSWNAKPVVIDKDGVIFKGIHKASTLPELIDHGNVVRSKVQSLLGITRNNLDGASAGNYGIGLLAAGIGLSSLHSDALLGASYLGGAHVALSTRLSPEGYMQQLRNTAHAFSCLNGVTLNYSTSSDKAIKALNSSNFVLSNSFTAKRFDADVNSQSNAAIGQIREAYLKALEISQDKLDSKITVSSPIEIQNKLIEESKQAGKSEGDIEALTTDDKDLINFLKKQNKLTVDLTACTALL